MNTTTEGKLSAMKQLMQMLTRSRNYTDTNIGEIAQTTIELAEEIDDLKADKPMAISFSIPTTGWQNDGTTNYPYYYDLAVSDVTAADHATVTIALEGIGTAAACGLCAMNETIAGAIRLRAASVPAAAIPAEYWLETGRSES
ncbi:MAG: hypothetical protein Q4P20_06720 [Eubacteriales bacterium]|nr:hypothetical protein [Eubacteriales bacterium]